LSCHETRELIHGYLDGELDLVKSLEVESHLEDCTACAQTYKGVRGLRSALGQRAVRFELPKDFQGRLRSALRHEDEPQRRSTIFRWQWLVAATSLITVIAVIWAVAGIPGRQAQGDVIAQEIVSSHVRSLMADHLTDVASSDQHTVKPWLDTKLDFAAPVLDLSGDGFPLVGGRLDYLDNHSAAALVYQRRKHFINLFIWPTTPGDSKAQKMVEREGYHLVHWADGDFTYWAVSDVSVDDLQNFQRSFEQQVPPH